jgi:hypothetical protein
MTRDTTSDSIPPAIATAGPAACGAWADFVAGDGLQPSTRKLYRNRARQFLAWLEPQGIGLAAVTRATVESYLDGQATCDHERMIYRTPLRRLFDALAAHGAIPANPAGAVRRSNGRGVSAGETSTAADEAAPTLDDLKSVLFDLDHISEGSDYFRPGLVAMYPLVVGGMDIERIAAFTGLPPAEVELYAGRLRENGVWTPDGKVAVDFEDADSAEAALNLVLIVGCAAGVFERGPLEDPPLGTLPTGQAQAEQETATAPMPQPSTEE